MDQKEDWSKVRCEGTGAIASEKFSGSIADEQPAVFKVVHG
jgi:hypothetical protein